MFLLPPKKWPVAGLALLLGASGVLYQALSAASDRRSHPMPGVRVDVGGYRMHLDCTGAGHPTVILDSGLGGSYFSWHKVQPAIAGFTRVCSYDRAGLGYSDDSPHSRTARDIALELHQLLHKAGIGGPLILVGHSMGGYDLRLYATLFPEDVGGMVLVDSSHPEQEKRLPPEKESWVPGVVAYTLPIGLPRLLGLCGEEVEFRAAECNFHSAREGMKERAAFPESARQAAATGSLGDLPLTVLSRDPASDAGWEKLQEELVHLSTRGTQVIASGSSHYIQLDRPDLVVEAVHDLVRQVP